MLIGGEDLRGMMEAQSYVISHLVQEAAEEKTRMEMEYLRYVRDLMQRFLRVLDAVDGDALRFELEKGLSDLEDHVARLEEHAA